MSPLAPPAPTGRALLVAVAAALASGVVPALAITAYALTTRDAAAIAAVAGRVAEPLALAASAAVIGAAPSPAGRLGGAGRGALAALLLALLAWWVGDLDRWTLAAALLLPAVGALRARDGRVADGRQSVASLPPAAARRLAPAPVDPPGLARARGEDAASAPAPRAR